MVSTIAVKRSKESAALEAGIDEVQSNFTKFHLGQGGSGGGSVRLILLCWKYRSENIPTYIFYRLTKRLTFLQTDIQTMTAVLKEVETHDK